MKRALLCLLLCLAGCVAVPHHYHASRHKAVTVPTTHSNAATKRINEISAEIKNPEY